MKKQIKLQRKDTRFRGNKVKKMKKLYLALLDSGLGAVGGWFAGEALRGLHVFAGLTSYLPTWAYPAAVALVGAMFAFRAFLIEDEYEDAE